MASRFLSNATVYTLLSPRTFSNIQAVTIGIRQIRAETPQGVRWCRGVSSHSTPHVSEFQDPNPLTQQAETALTTLSDPHNSLAEIEATLPVVRKAVLENSPRAKTLLASLYREGLVVEKNSDEAIRLFYEAAVEGDPIAQCSLGSLQLSILEEEQNSAVEPDEFSIAMDGEGKIRGQLGLKRSDGSTAVEKQTPAELVREVRKARRKAGFSDQEAQAFEDHKQAEKDAKDKHRRDEAISWLEKAVAQGLDTAMVVLGNELVQKQPQRAVELFESAVKLTRNVSAYFNLGQIHEFGLCGINKDEKKSLKNYAMAAQLGDASAQLHMGLKYQSGSEIVDVDMASARQFLEMAAEQKEPGAIYFLSMLHRNGEGGLEPNDGAFFRRLSEAAELGYGPALSMMGDLYYKGEVVEADYQKALHYFTEAGRQGEGEAYCSAAAMHFHGIGKEKDHHQAFILYQEAMVLGSTRAMRNMGSMYFHGHGVPANEKMAHHFFKSADDIEAERRKREMEGANTTIRITEAPPHPMGSSKDPFVPGSASTAKKLEDLALSTSKEKGK